MRWVLALATTLVACKGGDPKATTGSGSNAGSAIDTTTPSTSNKSPNKGAASKPGEVTATGSASSTIDGGLALTGNATAQTPAEDQALGANIALAALGGHIVFPTPPPPRSNEAEVALLNLIDGVPILRGTGPMRSSFGYRVPDRTLPHDIVFAFNQERVATISTVVIDTGSRGNLEHAAGLPKAVEVFVSTTSPTDGFTSVAKAELPTVVEQNVLRFPATQAKYVKVQIQSVHRNAAPELGEVEIYEAAGSPSIVADVEKNLLLYSLGGSLVEFSSQRDTGLAFSLIDGVAVDGKGWQSHESAAGSAKYLPQEFTLAFRDHRPATIDRIVIDPTSGIHGYTGKKRNLATWPTSVEVMVSDESAWRNFRSLGIFAVQDAPLTVPVGATIRFVKVRILETHGGERATLGEIQAFEGKPADGRSLVAGRRALLEASGSTDVAGEETSTRKEKEPNDSIKEADTLDTLVGGTITPASDRDIFKVVGQSAKQTVTVQLEGKPAIRTALKVTDTNGVTRYELEAARTATDTTFSVQLDPGDAFIHLAQPPSAQVVIWDTSGSMKDRFKDLDVALRAYLAGTRPGDRVNLIRFSSNVEILLQDFTDSADALVAALTGKVRADGATAIYDAIKKGLELLEHQKGNRVIVMMSDGEDTQSRTDPAAFWASLRSGGVRLYTIGLGNGLRNYVARAGAPADRVLANAAEMTGGRYLFAAEASQLTALYNQIGEEMRAPATYAISASSTAGKGTLELTALNVSVPLRVELVLDASGSMKRKLGGKTMMQIAQATLADVVAKLPEEAQVALRLYGHRTAEGKPKACEDSQLVIPFGKLDRKAMMSKINGAKALGSTPIAYSIAEATKDLANTKGPAMLILVTDGKEECNGDPKAAVEALRASGVDATINIVGFALTNKADRDYMTSVASAGGGKFYDAKDDKALKGAIDEALAVPYSVLDANGAVVAKGGVGAGAIEVPAGEFTVRIEATPKPVVIEHVKIEDKKPTSIELKQDGDEIAVKR